MELRNTEIDNDYFFVVKRLISILHVPVQFDPYLIWYHPGYPGLLSVKDTLISMGFSVDAYNIKDLSLSGVPTPSVIHLQRPGGDHELVIIKKITREKVGIESFGNGKMSLLVKNFKELWDGNILTISFQENENASSEAMLEKDIGKTRIIFFIGLTLTAVLVILRLFMKSTTSLDWRLLLTSLLGFSISTFLLIKELKLRPIRLLEKFCEHKNFSCAKVLQSKDVSLFFGLAWAEVGLIYFSGMLINLICCCIHGSISLFNFAASWLSLLTIPAIFYAIYVQLRVIKNLCLLCVLVHGLLIVNICISTNYLSNQIDVAKLFFLATFFIGFLVVAFFWLLIKLLLNKNSTVLTYKERNAAFKSNTDYFDHVLKSQRALSNKLIEPDMTWGRSDASVRVVGVLSFNCKYCYTVCRELILLKEIFADDLTLKIIFVPKETSSLDPLLIEILLKSKDQDQLLDSWLKTEYNKNTSSVPIDSHAARDKISSVLKKRTCWLVENEIKATPQVSINDSVVREGLSPMDFLFYLRKKINYGH